MALNVGYLTSDRTEDGDEVYTPYYAVDPILEFVPKDKIIWCPFDEEWSAFYQTFKRGGYNVVRSSLSEGQDFFQYEPKEWDIMISNPPFSKKVQVMKRAFELGKPFALILPANSIQHQKLHKIFNNDIQMLAFDARIGFHTGGNMVTYTKSPPFGSAYFCRNFLPTKLELRFLKKYEKPLIEV